jgi:hypothetical protein
VREEGEGGVRVKEQQTLRVFLQNLLVDSFFGPEGVEFELPTVFISVISIRIMGTI